jgi:hypothetical protein
MFRNLAVCLLRGLKGKSVGAIAHVDATASGLQIMATSLGDVIGMLGSKVCEYGEESRKDSYTLINDAVKKHVDLGINRTDMKYDCTMPWMYGGSAGVRQHFGDLEHLFYQGAAEEFPSAYRFLNVLKDKWAKGRIHGQFTLPDGVVVHINRVKDKHTLLRTPMGVMHLNDKEIGTDRGQFVAHLSAVIHGLDGWIVRECVRYMADFGKPIVTVHDSFGVHPNDVPLVQTAYKQCLVRLVKEPILQNILKELFYVDFGLTNNLDDNEVSQVCDAIMKARYVLC